MSLSGTTLGARQVGSFQHESKAKRHEVSHPAQSRADPEANPCGPSTHCPHSCVNQSRDEIWRDLKTTCQSSGQTSRGLGSSSVGGMGWGSTRWSKQCPQEHRGRCPASRAVVRMCHQWWPSPHSVRTDLSLQLAARVRSRRDGSGDGKGFEGKTREKELGGQIYSEWFFFKYLFRTM